MSTAPEEHLYSRHHQVWKRSFAEGLGKWESSELKQTLYELLYITNILENLHTQRALSYSKPKETQDLKVRSFSLGRCLFPRKPGKSPGSFIPAYQACWSKGESQKSKWGKAANTAPWAGGCLLKQVFAWLGHNSRDFWRNVHFSCWDS